MPGTYVTDLRHYLDDDGELADMPAEAKQLASFLVLIVDAVTPERTTDLCRNGITVPDHKVHQ